MKRTIRPNATLWAAVAATSLVVGCSSTSGSVEAGTYVVGLEASLTGTFGIYGVPQQQGAQIAIDEINSTKFLGDSKLAMDVIDSQSTPAGAISAYKSFASDEKYVGIMCCVASTIGTPLKPIAVTSKVPTIITGAAAAGLPELPYVYRTVSDPARPGSLYDQTIDNAAKNWKPKTAVVVYTSDSDSFAGNTLTVWTEALKRNNITILGEISSLQADTDFSAVASEVVSLNPDLLVANTFSNATANLMRGLVQFGYEGHAVSSYGVDSLSVRNIAGEAMANMTFAPAFSALSENPISQKFVKAYQEKYKETPDQYAAEGYNSIMFLALGIKDAAAKGDVTRETVTEALSELKSWQSTNGDFTMDEGDSVLTGKAIFLQWNKDATQSVVWADK